MYYTDHNNTSFTLFTAEHAALLVIFFNHNRTENIHIRKSILLIGVNMYKGSFAS